jgi:hypothetical protein
MATPLIDSAKTPEDQHDGQTWPICSMSMAEKGR